MPSLHDRRAPASLDGGVAKAGRKSGLASWAWLLVAGVVVFELLAHARIRSQVPDRRDWEQAASFVRARFGPDDGLISAPRWTDPILRHHLGELLSLRTASEDDRAGTSRVWELGIRGATNAADATALEESFGGVVVRRWPVQAEIVLYDFVEHVPSAAVSVAGPAGEASCGWKRTKTHGGGLGRGPLPPAERFVCDPSRPWLWVGPTVMADLELKPRRCIIQHPAGAYPVRASFSEVPLGTELVVDAGLYYSHERTRENAPVTLRVFIDDVLAGEMVHEDGQGWVRLAIPTAERDGQTATVRFETTTEDSYARSFCWAASTRRPGDDS